MNILKLMIQLIILSTIYINVKAKFQNLINDSEKLYDDVLEIPFGMYSDLKNIFGKIYYSRAIEHRNYFNLNYDRKFY